ncbi:MAG: tetratricopeptide repeat-containing sulfotransferase family protein [Gammaproteobacteria bacterium]
MANQYVQIGRLDQAEALFRQILRTEPNAIPALIGISDIYHRTGQAQLSREFLDRALAVESPGVNDCLSLAEACKSRGRFDEALELQRYALKLEPDNAELYRSFVAAKSFTAYDEDVRSLEASYRRSESGSKDRCALAFALGKVFDDLGEYQKAFDLFSEGGTIAKRQDPHSIDDYIAHCRAVTKTFDADFLRRNRNVGIDSTSALFIVGLPRSGTTLVERILASHPKVRASGEMNILGPIVTDSAVRIGGMFPAIFVTVDASELKMIGERYRDETDRMLRPGESFVTNKNLGCVLYAALIRVALPGAKIIYCLRDPRDQGLSYFQQHFLRQPYSYDLRDIGKFNRAYTSLYEHWNTLMPDDIHRIEYERLVSEPEQHVRNLLDHCGLDFDPACLAFHKSDDPVATASQKQVREPIHTRSIGRWKNYARQLKPLLDELGVTE